MTAKTLTAEQRTPAAGLLQAIEFRLGEDYLERRDRREV